MTFTDKVLVCRECGASFIFTSGEQEFFAMKGLQNEPGRCTDCRSVRRQQRDTGGAMGDYRPRREMHDAVCATPRVASPSRSSRACSDACKDVGTLPPDDVLSVASSTNACVNSSTYSGIPSLRLTISSMIWPGSG